MENKRILEETIEKRNKYYEKLEPLREENFKLKRENTDQ